MPLVGALVFLEADGGAELPDVVTELVVVVPIGHVRHEVGQAVGDGIELVLGRMVTARLAVLEQRDEEDVMIVVVVLISS